MAFKKTHTELNLFNVSETKYIKERADTFSARFQKKDINGHLSDITRDFGNISLLSLNKFFSVLNFYLKFEI